MTFDPDAPQNETDPFEAIDNVPEAAESAPPLLDENMDEQNPDAAILANPQWGGVAMLSMAASMTEGIAPAAVIAANYNLFRARDLHDEFNMTNGGGTLENFARKALEGIDRDDPDGDDDDKDDDGLSYADVAQEREERRHEREEWSRSEHEFAGVEMTGEEWSAFADELKADTPLRRSLVDDIKKREKKGEADAQTEADRIALLAKMQSMPKDQWTQEMKTFDQQLSTNPDERAKYQGYIERANQHRDPTFGQNNTVETTSTDATQTQSVSVAADALDAPTFPGVLPLKTEYNAVAAPNAPTVAELSLKSQTAFAKAKPMPQESAGLA